jgi:hypothetical protein
MIFWHLPLNIQKNFLVQLEIVLENVWLLTSQKNEDEIDCLNFNRINKEFE